MSEREIPGCELFKLTPTGLLHFDTNDKALPEQHGEWFVGLEDHNREVGEYQRWVDDLQSGMFVNCVYCGHRYGPKETTPVSMADILKAHIEKCPKHPMSLLKNAAAAQSCALNNIAKAFADWWDNGGTMTTAAFALQVKDALKRSGFLTPVRTESASRAESAEKKG